MSDEDTMNKSWQSYVNDLCDIKKNKMISYCQSLFKSHTTLRLLLIFYAIITSVMITAHFQQIPDIIDVGMIASRDIRADRNYDISDDEATKLSQKKAIDSVLPVYDLDEIVLASIVKRVNVAFANARTMLFDFHSKQKKTRKNQSKNKRISNEQSQLLKELFESTLGISLRSASWNAIKKEKFSEASQRVIVDFLNSLLTQPVISQRASLDANGARGVIIRRVVSQNAGKEASIQYVEETVSDINVILSVENLKQKLDQISVSSRGIVEINHNDKIKRIVGKLVEPNLSYNRAETLERQNKSLSNVKGVVIKIKAAEMIIREGSRYEPWHVKVIDGIRQGGQSKNYIWKFIGTLFIVIMFLIMPFLLANRFFKRIHFEISDFFLMAMTSFGVLVIIRLALGLAPVLHTSLFFNVPTEYMKYAIPVAAGAMLIRMYLSAEISFLFSLSCSVLSGMMLGAGIELYGYYFMMSIIATMMVAHVDKRSSIIRAGIITGLGGMLISVGAEFISISSSSDIINISQLFVIMLLAFISGIGSAIIVMIMAPIVESISGYTSDIKLLELANLNHPLLRELIVRAPGTYHHSHLVGVLGEAAAESIGANSLLVRVGAYYHDIGKMKKTQYFIENAKTGENRHDKLNPNMSAMIVATHVKEGLDMANRAGIPKVISDMIPQHHGTRLISFFYNKAKEMEDPSVERIDPKKFQYPGPKPQTREAAILMLADVTEASVRSLKEKSSVRIEQTVTRSINDIFTESQLDECDLTLRDLHYIGQAFVHILLGIYHQRIEYPKGENKGDNHEIQVVSGNALRPSENS